MIYKIKHKQIKRSFSARDVRFIDDFYLVSYIDSFSVVARRDGSNRLVHGDNFCEFVDVRDRALLKSYVYEASDLPLILRTDIGTAIINKYFISSTLLYSVSFLCDEDGTQLTDALLRSGSDSVLLPDYYDRGTDAPGASKGMINKTLDVLNNYKALIKDTFVPMDAPPKITVEKLYNAIEGIARFSGCSVDVTLDAELICMDIFDLVAFKNFILAMLMLARRESRSRSASVEVTCFGREVSVRVSFDTDNSVSVFDYREVNHFFDFADRNNMLFEAFDKDGHISVRFCPSRKDWSLLELKAYIDFDWNA